ncbi:MAG: HTH-type transcriptional activator IlvY [Gammaproteobacteria bacterium]|nr:HTH-type transcriptional activator IlvY [Gammaproteobacteria bacterium]
MDPRLLKQFVKLADTLHFGRASEACHVSPSALSRSIRQLEREAGARLFDRDNRSVRLTHAGELFQAYARDSLVQWDVIRNTLMEESGELHGEVSMYCSVTASYSFLFEILSAFRRDHPRIEIKLHTGDPEDAITRVLGGTEDIAIGAKPPALPGGLTFKTITVSPLVFIAARNRDEYQCLSADEPEAAAWAATPMILSERGLARSRVDEWFKSLGVRASIYAQVAGNEAIVSMVSLGFGVGVVPRIVLENSPLVDTITVLDVSPELEAYEVGLLTLEKKLKNPLINALWSRLR